MGGWSGGACPRRGSLFLFSQWGHVQARCAGMFGFFFSEHPITCFEDAAKHADGARFAKYHRMMLERGIYLAPSMYEAGFTSLAHTDAQIDKTLEAVRDVFAQL